jgi:Receptor family ligand binding region
MTSVQNLLQPLNGNKLIIFLAIVSIGFSSCDAFKKAQTDDPVVKNDKDVLPEVKGNTVYDPETGTYVHSKSVTEELDTVKWKIAPQDDNPPITSAATKAQIDNPVNPVKLPPVITGISEKLEVYNVAIMLPFLSDRSNVGTEVDNRAIPTLQFYGGAKMALDVLSGEGVKLNVTVHDTKGSEAVVQSLMNSRELKTANLIIGPLMKNNIKVAAEWAKKMQVPLVSPLSPSSNVVNDNPYFIQVSPYLNSHCQAITKHVLEKYSADKLVLVVRNKRAEISRLKYFQESNQAFQGTDKTERLKEFIVTDESADFNEMDVSPYLKEGDTTVFIVPSWSNESFIYSLLRKIQVAKVENEIECEVVVYGMPQWRDYERISYDYYEQLNVHISSASYIDPNSEKVKKFRKDYFNKYGTVPNTEAFVGYDVMLYFGRMMAKYGTYFQDRLDGESAEYLQTEFDIVREVPLSAVLEEDYSKTNLFENKHVHILKFKDYYFQHDE